jgi:hypothetical protein
VRIERDALEDVYRELMRFARRAKKGELTQLRSDALEARGRILSLHTDAAVKGDLAKTLNYIAAIFYLRGYQDCEHHQQRLRSAHRTPLEHRRLRKAIDKLLRTDSKMNESVEEHIQLEYPLQARGEATLIGAICERLDHLQVRASFRDQNGDREPFGHGGRSWIQEPLSSAARETIRRILRRFRADERAKRRQQLFRPASAAKLKER